MSAMRDAVGRMVAVWEKHGISDCRAVRNPGLGAAQNSSTAADHNQQINLRGERKDNGLQRATLKSVPRCCEHLRSVICCLTGFGTLRRCGSSQAPRWLIFIPMSEHAGRVRQTSRFAQHMGGLPYGKHCSKLKGLLQGLAIPHFS